MKKNRAMYRFLRISNNHKLLMDLTSFYNVVNSGFTTI